MKVDDILLEAVEEMVKEWGYSWSTWSDEIIASLVKFLKAIVPIPTASALLTFVSELWDATADLSARLSRLPLTGIVAGVVEYAVQIIEKESTVITTKDALASAYLALGEAGNEIAGTAGPSFFPLAKKLASVMTLWDKLRRLKFGGWLIKVIDLTLALYIHVVRWHATLGFVLVVVVMASRLPEHIRNNALRQSAKRHTTLRKHRHRTNPRRRGKHDDTP